MSQHDLGKKQIILKYILILSMEYITAKLICQKCNETELFYN